MPAMKRAAEGENEVAASKKMNVEYDQNDIKSFFHEQVWDEKFQDKIKDEITNSQPFRWGSITELMNDDLLRQVRKEVLTEIAFTKKETDIYKVYQSGDLANLSGLNWDDLSRLPSLYKLRSAIYSEQFRDVISKITGCGKLSGVKTDMSINTYTKGCHLLTHDDVIGSRRVSFILYLPDPDKTWKAHYGGGLRLFPAIVPNVPKADFEVKLVPQFNQIAFFTVQPGLSFHDVEEVRVDKQRLSIQGWFHIPQPGESGYIPGEQAETEARSTLQQLQTKELQEYDFPKPIRQDIGYEELKKYEQFSENLQFSESEVEYLGQFLNPVYTDITNVKQLNDIFMEESVVEIKDILQPELAALLHKTIIRHEIDKKVPFESSEFEFPWKCAIPPHKQRYMYIDGKKSFNNSDRDEINLINNVGPQEHPNFSLSEELSKEPTDKLLLKITSFFKSIAFKKWLTLVTGLITTSEQILARRFRPGHDFILATTSDKQLGNGDNLDVLLEATLNLTPTATDVKNWESGEFGGYELCMALNNDEEDGEFEDDDPAVYKASDANDDSVLYTSQCKWNSLCLMLRDPSVLKFVKYVSINAKGSRWDISAQWNVKSDDDSDEEEDEER